VIVIRSDSPPKNCLDKRGGEGCKDENSRNQVAFRRTWSVRFEFYVGVYLRVYVFLLRCPPSSFRAAF